MVDHLAYPVRATCSRRAFALGSGAALTSAWLAANWPGIAAAAAHAAHVASATEPATLGFLSAADAADVEALAAQIIPSGATPGAKKMYRTDVAERVGAVHLLGTCRMEDDPASSVVDKYHRSHDVKNLFVCDGSSFVTSGRGQPTMTIQALAFRAADHIARFAKRNEI